MKFKIILENTISFRRKNRYHLFRCCSYAMGLLAWEIMKILNKKVYCFKRTGPANAIYLEQEIFGIKSNPFKFKKLIILLQNKKSNLLYEYLKI